MVTGSKINISAKDLKLNCLPSATRRAFLEATKFNFLNNSKWYLAGGTALTLQVGHRRSEDLDFFTTDKTFKETQLERLLFNSGHWVTSLEAKGTLYGTFMNAKMSFIAYPFFRPSNTWLQCDMIKILLPDDIMAMKIIAVSQRGKKRDFVDIYWYATHLGSLQTAIKSALKQYPEQKQNVGHLLKSLVYFADAEDDPIPDLLFKVDWKNIKAYFKREVPKITNELLVID